MNKLKKIQNTINTISFIFGVLVEQFLTTLMKNNEIFKSDAIYFIISIITILLAFIFLQYTLKKVTNSNKIKKIILAEHYLAGIWVEIIYDNEKKEKVGYGIKRITYNGDIVNYEGDNFDIENFNHTGSFSANFLSLDFPYINYKYTWDKNESYEKIEGIGQVKFIKRTNKYPIAHTGFFIDLKSGHKFNFTSWKIIDVDLISKIENPKTYREILKEITNKIDSEKLVVV